MEKIQIVTPKFFIKSKTNSGDLSKQYFLEAQLKDDSKSKSLVIKRLILSDKLNDIPDSKLLKVYKGKGLFVQSFAIRVETLYSAISVLNRK